MPVQRLIATIAVDHKIARLIVRCIQSGLEVVSAVTSAGKSVIPARKVFRRLNGIKKMPRPAAKHGRDVDIKRPAIVRVTTKPHRLVTVPAVVGRQGTA